MSKISKVVGTMLWLSSLSLSLFLANNRNVALAFITAPSATTSIIRKHSSALRVATDPTETKKSDNILFGKFAVVYVCIMCVRVCVRVSATNLLRLPK